VLAWTIGVVCPVHCSSNAICVGPQELGALRARSGETGPFIALGRLDRVMVTVVRRLDKAFLQKEPTK